LKDYSPSTNYGARLEAISREVRDIEASDVEDGRSLAVPGHPLRRNPLFAHLFSRKGQRGTLAMTKVFNSREAAMSIDSPQGLLLHGEVGTGKSFLVDLLAESLPNPKKRRWHFNTFMLETLARLEQLRESRSASVTGEDEEHSLIWLSKDMVEKSPIIFLDEFQLPDRAASKILSNLFTTFFQLGGVLIATSNRMPDELAKASGMDFAAPPRGGIVKNWLGLGSRAKTNIFPSSNEYGDFVEVLKARCEIWNMEGGRDWRRREAEETGTDAGKAVSKKTIGDFEGLKAPGLSHMEVETDRRMTDNQINESARTTPKNYMITSDNTTWEATIQKAFLNKNTAPIPWESKTLHIYGRRVLVPQHFEGVTYWSFSDLCKATFGPADYITLASTFHTLIIDDVPVLTLTHKNEARRLITLLDALYETRCKLIVRAGAGPDDLFFPEAEHVAICGEGLVINRDSNDSRDAVYPETLSEIYQDQTSPFRPNISSLEGRNGYDPDEDSDFSPPLNDGNGTGRTVDFGMTGSFTGEDERFAYKRARSRLWEMCSARWHARSEPGWWRPLPLETRRWERSRSTTATKKTVDISNGDVTLGPSIDLDRPAGLQGREIEEREKGNQISLRGGIYPPKKN
jgi:protein AFG1